ncbi:MULTISPECIES: hypothetical protein [unclassified Sphingomonas]|uniref:hypothetical protein n=1 Tax=unclassified Sphingomonas TaxID=196159 RepID=UPI001AD464FF|nr:MULTISPECIES: hypothetical protein [unclassified Sphingomonas]MBN8847300.1 hypothetical protein [Sphingomonas sp.]
MTIYQGWTAGSHIGEVSGGSNRFPDPPAASQVKEASSFGSMTLICYPYSEPLTARTGRLTLVV